MKELSELQNVNNKLQKIIDHQQNSMQKVLNLQAMYQRENDMCLEKTYHMLKTEFMEEVARREHLRSLHAPNDPLSLHL